jgi:hypothetical protein
MTRLLVIGNIREPTDRGRECQSVIVLFLSLMTDERLIFRQSTQPPATVTEACEKLKSIARRYNNGGLPPLTPDEHLLYLSSLWGAIGSSLVLYAVMTGYAWRISENWIACLLSHLLVYATAVCVLSAVLGCFGKFGITRDKRFSGAHPGAPAEERIRSLWKNPSLQKDTDAYWNLREGNFWSSSPALDADALCEKVPLVYREMTTNPDTKGEFEELSAEERVRVVCWRVLFLSFEGKE